MVVMFVFMLIQFLRGVPRDMEEAAQIDGCNSIQVLWYVVLGGEGQRQVQRQIAVQHSHFAEHQVLRDQQDGARPQGFFVFMLIQFLRGVPRDMEEAAQIDGCNSIQVIMAGLRIGTTTYHSTWMELQPSICAASSISRGTT
jgi:ABC-type polysaccharide transport system permease subunit